MYSSAYIETRFNFGARRCKYRRLLRHRRAARQGDAPAGYTATRTDGRDDGTDWGWLGLLGLTGLLGLIPKRRREEADYRATDTASRATAR